MFDRLQSVEDRYEKLNELLSDPDIVSDPEKLKEYSKEQSAIAETVETYREYKEAKKNMMMPRKCLMINWIRKCGKWSRKRSMNWQNGSRCWKSA